jgi:anti-sigma regulatory factor (Ser/Thr protein kinase)
MLDISMKTEVAIRANAEEIRSASEWLGKVCTEHDVPAEQLYRLDLCLNEVLTNILDHGEEQALSEPIELRFSIDNSPEARRAAIVVSDAGAPFDPITAPAPARPNNLAEAVPGGLGLLMVRSLSDELHYAYQNDHNRLSFAVRWRDGRS